MRKFLALGSFALLALCFSIPALAQNRWAERDVSFRSSCLTCYGGYVDSSTASGSAVRSDTTASVPLLDWAIPVITSAGTDQIDSLLFATLSFYPAPGNTAITTAADSIFVEGQISTDGGNTWQGWGTPTQLFHANITTGWANLSGSNVLQVLERGTTNTFWMRLMQTFGALTLTEANNQGTAPTPNQLFGHSAIRFIISGDMTGTYVAKINHWRVN